MNTFSLDRTNCLNVREIVRANNNYHLITRESVIKRLSLYVFALWGQDLVSVVRIREGPYYRGYF